MSCFGQNGTITDDDGMYIPGEDGCSWILAPVGARRIHLVISKLELGGLDGNDNEGLQIVVCKDMECSNPTDIPGSPFNQNSDYFSGLFGCSLLDSWMYPSQEPIYQVFLLYFLSTLTS
jgi:hypothetical protein